MSEQARAAVSSPHYLASQAGEQVLQQGGTAMDAAITTNAVLSVVYPHMCGLGGDLFMLHFDAATGEVSCLNASGPAAELATTDFYRAQGHQEVPVRGPESVTVPGTVAGWEAGLSRFGRLGWSSALAPAAALATHGFPVSAGLSRWIAKTSPEIVSSSALHRMLAPKGQWLQTGDKFRLADLAGTLDILAEYGSSAFYQGEIAERIGSSLANAGGPLRTADLAGYVPEWVSPVSTTFEDYQLFVPPPNSQGATALLMLQEFQRLGGAPGDTRDSSFYERFIQAKHHGFRFRNRYIGDPAFHKSALTDTARALSGTQPSDHPPAMSDYPPQGDTIGLVTRDRWGNACAVIQSLYYGFGSLFIPDGTGVLMHNRGHYFSLDPGRVNSLTPGKRPTHTLMCLMALQSGRPRFIISSMGADGQPQFVSQVLLNLMSGQDPQASIESPRILHGRFALEDHPDVVRIEPMPQDVAAGLIDAGHEVEVTDPHSETMGHAQAIAVTEDGLVAAGYDPRSDGSAVVC